MLASRKLEPEVMDQPGLDSASHHLALAGLSRVNSVSRSSGAIWRLIQRHALENRAGPLRVLDVASGGGDVAIGLWRRARAAGVELQIVGLDISATACDHAHRLAEESNAPIAFQQCDVLQEELPKGFDIAVSTLFLHHLEDDDVVCLLRKMALSANYLAISDLRRSSLGYAIAWAGCRLLTRSSIVHVDGPRSVAAAFTLAEVDALCRKADLGRIEIRRSWPWRFTLTGQTICGNGQAVPSTPPHSFPKASPE